MINVTDSSLLREWEQLKTLEAENENEAEPERLDALLELRALRARGRVEARRLARLLALGRWQEAQRCVDFEDLRAVAVRDGRRPFGKPQDFAIELELEEEEDGASTEVKE